MAVDLRVSPGWPVTYRGLWRPWRRSRWPPPSTFYLIPGCYMGNIPPKDAHLPRNLRREPRRYLASV